MLHEFQKEKRNARQNKELTKSTYPLLTRRKEPHYRKSFSRWGMFGMKGGQKVTDLDSDTLFLDGEPRNHVWQQRWGFQTLGLSQSLRCQTSCHNQKRTLRDWFAGLVMQQLLKTVDDDSVADWAYYYADMMLKERNK